MSVWKWVGVFVYPRQVEPQGTLKHCLQISEGLSQGIRIGFVFWHPKGKIDTRGVVVREAEMKITFLDVRALWWHVKCSALFNPQKGFVLGIKRTF